jgi:hypothetical protein
MDKIVIRSNDRELLKKTWSIHSHDGLERWVINEIKPDGFAELTIFLREQYSTLPFLVGLLEFIDARVRLRRTQSSTELHVTTYSDRVDLEVHTDSTGYLTPLATDER